jgi:hypothetical protein
MSLSAMSAAQLSPSEAVSMSALLDDCCEKLAFLGTISPDVNEHKMEESNRIGDEMSRIIAEQRQLEDKFEQLIQQRSELKASSNKKRAEENKEEIKEVARQLKLKTKLLCRNLKVSNALSRCARWPELCAAGRRPFRFWRFLSRARNEPVGRSTHARRAAHRITPM